MDKVSKREDIYHIIEVFNKASINSGGVFDLKICESLEVIDSHPLIADPTNSVLFSEVIRD